jgi:polyadenylate-binding protein
MANFHSSEKKSLHIGDLPVTVDEQFLLKLITDVVGDDSATTKVDVRASKFGESQFAFVQVTNEAEAKKILENLNYTKLDGKPIRITFADPETHRLMRKGIGNLFIKNLHPDIEVSQLHEAFQRFGDIISCRIPLTNGKSRRYGFVQFRYKEDAERAKTDLADASISGEKIKIDNYVKRPRADPEATFTNVFFKDLPEELGDENAFRTFCEQYGETKSVRVTQTAEEPIRYNWFCDFQRHEDAVACIDKENGRVFSDQHPKIFAARAQPRKERLQNIQLASQKFKAELYEKTRGRNLYVRGFDENWGEEDLINYYAQYGEIESSKLMKDENGMSRKFGFVCFRRKEDAEKAIKNTIIRQDGPQLFTAHMQPKAMRKAFTPRANQQQTPTQPAQQSGNQFGVGVTVGGQKDTPAVRLTRELSERVEGQILVKELKNVSEQQHIIMLNHNEILEEWIERVLTNHATGNNRQPK